MVSNNTLRVVQLSDIHFDGNPSPVDGRDPNVSFRHCIEHLKAHGSWPDLFVATGDLTDDGTVDAAHHLGRALRELNTPVFALAGNHDSEATLGAMATEGVQAPTTSRHGNWLFCYLDSNEDGRVRNDDGTISDHPERMHHAAIGHVHPEDLAAFEHALATTDAEHVMVWVHHPPLAAPVFDNPAKRSTYFHTIHTLLQRHPKVQAMAFGHLHTGYEIDCDGIRYLGTLTTWLAMDFSARVLSAPGYRTFVFHDDGRIDTESVLIDHPDYAGDVPLPEWVDRVLAKHFGIDIEANS